MTGVLSDAQNLLSAIDSIRRRYNVIKENKEEIKYLHDRALNFSGYLEMLKESNQTLTMTDNMYKSLESLGKLLNEIDHLFQKYEDKDNTFLQFRNAAKANQRKDEISNLNSALDSIAGDLQLFQNDAFKSELTEILKSSLNQFKQEFLQQLKTILDQDNINLSSDTDSYPPKPPLTRQESMNTELKDEIIYAQQVTQKGFRQAQTTLQKLEEDNKELKKSVDEIKELVTTISNKLQGQESVDKHQLALYFEYKQSFDSFHYESQLHKYEMSKAFFQITQHKCTFQDQFSLGEYKGKNVIVKVYPCHPETKEQIKQMIKIFDKEPSLMEQFVGFIEMKEQKKIFVLFHHDLEHCPIVKLFGALPSEGASKTLKFYWIYQCLVVLQKLSNLQIKIEGFKVDYLLGIKKPNIPLLLGALDSNTKLRYLNYQEEIMTSEELAKIIFVIWNLFENDPGNDLQVLLEQSAFEGHFQELVSRLLKPSNDPKPTIEEFILEIQNILTGNNPNQEIVLSEEDYQTTFDSFQDLIRSHISERHIDRKEAFLASFPLFCQATKAQVALSTLPDPSPEESMVLFKYLLHECLAKMQETNTTNDSTVSFLIYDILMTCGYETVEDIKKDIPPSMASGEILTGQLNHYLTELMFLKLNDQELRQSMRDLQKDVDKLSASNKFEINLFKSTAELILFKPDNFSYSILGYLLKATDFTNPTLLKNIVELSSLTASDLYENGFTLKELILLNYFPLANICGITNLSEIINTLSDIYENKLNGELRNPAEQLLSLRNKFTPEALCKVGCPMIYMKNIGRMSFKELLQLGYTLEDAMSANYPENELVQEFSIHDFIRINKPIPAALQNPLCPIDDTNHDHLISDVLREKRLNSELIKAVVSLNISYAKQLIFLGADIKTTDSDYYRSIWILLTIQNKLEAIQELIDFYHALKKDKDYLFESLCIFDKGNYSVLHHAFNKGNKSILSYFVNDQHINVYLKAGGLNGFTISELAVENQDLTALRDLQDKYNVDLTKTYEGGKNLLFKAIEKNCSDIVKYFLGEFPTMISSHDNVGNNALFYAAKANNLELVKLLVESKLIDINHINNVNENALFNAAESNNEVMVKYLIDQGIDVNIKNNKGKDAGFVTKNKNIRELIWSKQAI